MHINLKHMSFKISFTFLFRLKPSQPKKFMKLQKMAAVKIIYMI